MDETVQDHKFVISLEEIKLHSTKQIQCTIRYNYKLFSDTEVCTSIFTINPQEDLPQKIPSSGFNEYQIHSRIKESEIKDFLKNNPLVIRLFDENTEIGNFSVNLMRLYDKSSFKSKQQSFKEDIPIQEQNHSNNENVGEPKIVGKMDCLFVLVKTECIPCKSCNKIFKVSGIQKHLSQRQDCKEGYNDEDIEALKENALKTRKKKQAARELQNYDPFKRAEKHQNHYHPIERNLQSEKE